MEYKLKFRCRTTPGQNIPPSRGLHCFELCFMDSHLLWTALPAFVSICSSLCCLHGLWILFLHRNTKPLQHSLVVWEKKRLIQFSQTGASWFIDTLYRGVRKKAEFSCSKNGNKMVGIFKRRGELAPGPHPVAVQGTGDWSLSVTSLLTGQKPPSVLRELFRGDVLGRILVIYPSFFGLLLQVLQQQGSFWRRAGTLSFSLH